MNYLLNFCEECGCKIELSDKFCTGCGLLVERAGVAIRSSEKVPSEPAASKTLVVPIPSVPIGHSVQQSPAAAQPVEVRSIQKPPPIAPQQPPGTAPAEAASTKSSSKSVVYALVALVALGGAGSFFMLKGDSLKNQTKNASAGSSQKQGAVGTEKSESGNRAPKITATGQMLVDAAVSENKGQFQALLHQLQTQPAAATVDRKLARSLNDEALAAMKLDDFTAAIEALNKAREADAADAEISNNLGYALRMAGDLKASQSQLISTIEQFPSRQQAWSDLGETYSKLGKHSQAVAAFMAAHRVAKTPDKLLEKYLKLAESTEDEALKADLAEAAQKISEAK